MKMPFHRGKLIQSRHSFLVHMQTVYMGQCWSEFPYQVAEHFRARKNHGSRSNSVARGDMFSQTAADEAEGLDVGDLTSWLIWL